MIPKKYTPIIFAIIMALSMSFFMSLVMTFINTGYDDGFWLRWGKSFLIGFSVALPTALIVAPITRKLVAAITT